MRMRRAGPGSSLGWDLAAALALGLLAMGILAPLLGDFAYLEPDACWRAWKRPEIRAALALSVWTSLASTALGLLIALPAGWALDRLPLPGLGAWEALVDLPLAFPPLVVGLSLLLFLTQTPPGRWLEGFGFIFQPKDIILCQCFSSAPIAVRAAQSAFAAIDRRLEAVALTLGLGPWEAFRRVTLPMAWNGILAGAVQAWARAFGLFGPLVILVGTVRGRTEVLSTTIYLEQSMGDLQGAVAVAMILILFAFAAMAAGRGLRRRARENM